MIPTRTTVVLFGVGLLLAIAGLPYPPLASLVLGFDLGVCLLVLLDAALEAGVLIGLLSFGAWQNYLRGL